MDTKTIKLPLGKSIQTVNLLLETTKFNTEEKYDVLELIEEGNLLFNTSGDGNWVQKTNTGTLTLNFVSDESSQSPSDGPAQSEASIRQCFKKLIFNSTSIF